MTAVSVPPADAVLPPRPGGVPFGAGRANGGLASFGGILASLTGAVGRIDTPGGLAAVQKRSSRTGVASQYGAIRQALFRPQAMSRAQATHAAARIAALPRSSDDALQQAMTLENVPASWRDSLRFIMANESGGQVNVKNPYHSARGLFQLTAANYYLNPNGAASFGNAVEEAQGGIRYIKGRYGTAANAVAFWQQHQWY